MIGETKRGKVFGGLAGYLIFGRSQESESERGLADYLVEAKSGPERVEWVATRNLPTDSPREAAILMQATARQNKRVQKPVYHLMLSADPGDELSAEDWKKVVDRVIEGLGLGEHEAVVVAHNDTAHAHVHVMVNTVHPEHLRVWDGSFDHPRIEKILRHLEREMGLREVPGHHYRLPGQERPVREGRATAGERRETERTGGDSWAERVRFRVYKVFKEAENWAELERGLARHGLRLRRRGGGLVVTDGKRLIKASRIYRRGSYGWLEKRFGMSFDEWTAGRRDLLAAIDRYQYAEREGRDLRRQRDRALREVERAERQVADRDRARGRTRRNAGEIRQALAEIYHPEHVPAVERHLVRHARQVGWREAGFEVGDRPERFGRLRAGRLQRLRRPAARRGLRRWTSFLASLARQRAVLVAARAAAGPVGYKAAERLLFSRGVYLRSKSRFEKWPTEKLLSDVAMRAAILGMNAVKLTLAPNPWSVVRTAVRSVQLVRSVGRVMGRGR